MRKGKASERKKIKKSFQKLCMRYSQRFGAYYCSATKVNQEFLFTESLLLNSKIFFIFFFHTKDTLRRRKSNFEYAVEG